MKITIETVKPDMIRCRQCGDWQWDGNNLVVYVNEEITDIRSQFLIGLHEAVEAMLCKEDGITDQEVTAFDCLFEEERTKGLHPLNAENGDDVRACYHQQHAEAMAVEMMLCSLLGMSWKEHNQEIESTL